VLNLLIIILLRPLNLPMNGLMLIIINVHINIFIKKYLFGGSLG
jgi:hypothetical protein